MKTPTAASVANPGRSPFVRQCQEALAEYLRDRAEGVTKDAAILPLVKAMTGQADADA